MPKLITPVQYESEFEGLNDVLPLILADEVKAGLSNPICNLTSVGEGRPALGKFLRCNNLGSLISHKTLVQADDFESSGIIVVADTDLHYFDFAQKVRFVEVFFQQGFDVAWGEWCTPSGTKIMQYSLDVFHFCPFEGTRFYYKCAGEDEYMYRFVVIGVF